VTYFWGHPVTSVTVQHQCISSQCLHFCQLSLSISIVNLYSWDAWIADLLHLVCLIVYSVPQTRLRTVGDQAFCVAAAKTWNSFPSEVTSSATLSTSKHRLKTYLFHCHSRHVISPFPHIVVQWLQCFFAFVHFKFLTTMTMNNLQIISAHAL